MEKLNIGEDKSFFIKKFFKEIKDLSEKIKKSGNSEKDLYTEKIKEFLKFRAYVIACWYTYANENGISLVRKDFENQIEFDNYLMLKWDFHDDFEKKIVEIFYEFEDNFTSEHIDFFRSNLFKNEVYGQGRWPSFRVEPRFRINSETNTEKSEHLQYFISKIKETVKKVIDFWN